MDNKLKFLMGFFVLIILTSSVEANWWIHNYTYVGSDQANGSWVADSTPTFEYEINANRSTFTHANITANNVVIETWTGATNGTNHTWSGTFYSDGSSTMQIEWNITLFQIGITPSHGTTSSTFWFGVDGTAPNITGYWPLDGAWSKLTTNYFNFTGDDTNNDTAVLYLSDNVTQIVTDRELARNDTLYDWGTELNSTTNNFTGADLNGTYYWDISMNDSANNVAWASDSAITYFTLYVDPDVPGVTGQPAANYNLTYNQIQFNVTADDANPNHCKLTIDGVDNQSGRVYVSNGQVNFTKITLSDGLHEYNFTCDDDAGGSTTTTPYWLNIDTIDPVIVINNINNTWETDDTLTFNFTLTETNPDSCYLWANFTDYGVFTFGLNQTNTSLKAGTDPIFTSVILDDSLYPDPYFWTVSCNDTSGRLINETYQAVNVDTTLPGVLYLIEFEGSDNQNYTYGETLFNGSTGTEVTQFPIAWRNSTGIDANFKEYRIDIDNDSTMASPYCTVYETNYLTNWTVLNCTLAYDTRYYYNVTAFDRAGNTNSTVNSTFVYTTAPEYAGIIYPGYNYLSIWRDDSTAHGVLNTSDLVTELSGNRTGGSSQDIDSISIYNISGHFETYSVDTPTINGDLLLYRGRPVIIHNDGESNIIWGGNRYYNIEFGNTTAYSINMSNNTNPWHLLGMLNYTGMKFQDLEDELGNTSGYSAAWFNGNPGITFNLTRDPTALPSMSYTNYTQTYSYFPTWGDPWNETKIYYGETFWLEIGTTYASGMCYNTTSGNTRFC